MATFTLSESGKKPITFKRGALHRQLNVPEGQKIPEDKKEAALRGEYGPLAKARAVNAFRGILAAGRRTALHPQETKRVMSRAKR